MLKFIHLFKNYCFGKHIGLYEKYGCEYKTEMNDMNDGICPYAAFG